MVSLRIDQSKFIDLNQRNTFHVSDFSEVKGIIMAWHESLEYGSRARFARQIRYRTSICLGFKPTLALFTNGSMSTSNLKGTAQRDKYDYETFKGLQES